MHAFPLASDNTVVMTESHVDRVTGAPGSIHGDASRFRATGLDDDKRKAKQQRESEGNDPETARTGGGRIGARIGGLPRLAWPKCKRGKNE